MQTLWDKAGAGSQGAAIRQNGHVVRIAGMEISNFRGLRHLELDGMEHEPVVLISGANGAGKSLVLEAIYLATGVNTFGLPGPEMIGPWGPRLSVRLNLWLSPDERIKLSELRDSHMPNVEGSAPEYVDISFSTQAGGPNEITGSDWYQLLLYTAQQVGQTFGQVDYLPADRQIPRGEAASISTDVLSEQRRQQLRQQAFQSATSRAVLALSGIKPVLATLDYLDLIQKRAGEETSSDFDLLASAFQRATGKRIPRPLPDPAGVSGARLVVETSAGTTHDLDQLSSGEQSVLGLMFYVRRLSATGGILLIDEPELHLHPALHPLLFSVLDDVAKRAQIWTVTHSTRLVTSTSAQALVHVRAAGLQDTNQAVQVRDDHDRLALLEDLGIDPAEALQADLLLIVEGESDRQILSRLLPVETGRAQYVIARDSSRVMATSNALAHGYAGGGWVAIRDRDMLNDDARTSLLEADSHLFIWPERTIENELLHPPLISRTFSQAGRRTGVQDAESLLDRLFDRQRPMIEAALLEDLLHAEHEIDIEGGQSVDQLKAFLAAVRDTAVAKLARLEAAHAEVSARLDAMGLTERRRLIDGKRALGELVAESPFGNKPNLVDALILQVTQAPDLAPPGLTDLRNRILREAIVGTAG